MKMKEAIIAAQDMLRAKANSCNGFAFIFEPKDGSEDGWEYYAYPLGACFAQCRGNGVKFSYIYQNDAFPKVTEKTHTIRFFIDFFNRNIQGQEKPLDNWKYIIQRSPFKSLFEKDTFKKQLENGVMFDMTKWRWRAIICAAISLRYAREYDGGSTFTALKKSGMKELHAWVSSWIVKKSTQDKDALLLPYQSGHAIVSASEFPLNSFKEWINGGCIKLEGDATQDDRDAYSSQELRIKFGGGAVHDEIRAKLKMKTVGPMFEQRSILPIKDFSSFIKGLVQK